jgi:predicted TIM-barrel fold metal-dependent hydrolase
MTPPVVVDADTHLIEAADLWTSRLPRNRRDETMQVRWNNDLECEMWYIGPRPFKKAWGGISHKFSADGEREQVEDERWVPATLAEAHPSAYDPAERVKLLDEWGIDAAVLYPNSAGFALEPFLEHPDPGISLAHVSAYNDYQLEEWVAAAPGRFVPMMALPYWDVPASVQEIERLTNAPFGGVVMTGAPHRHGQPHLISRHWDPLWRACEVAGLSVSFHLANGGVTDHMISTGAPPTENETSDQSPLSNPSLITGGLEPIAMSAVRVGAALFLDAARQATDLLCSGILARFPTLTFVMAESGIGWVPFVLEAIDTRFKRENVQRLMPEFGDAVPSDLFKRQVYVNFWFEHLLDFHVEHVGAGKILWETDYPHPTGLYYASISEVVDRVLGQQSAAVCDAVLGQNAMTLYGEALARQTGGAA